jgi:hypothetical protein
VLRSVEDSADYWLSHAERVPGWLTGAEARQLFELARGVALAGTPTAVEIGSWQGKSSIMIAGGLSANPDARLYCIDPFGIDESPEYQRLYYTELLEKMDRSVAEAFTDHVRQS